MLSLFLGSGVWVVAARILGALAPFLWGAVDRCVGRELVLHILDVVILHSLLLPRPRPNQPGWRVLAQESPCPVGHRDWISAFAHASQSC